MAGQWFGQWAGDTAGQWWGGAGFVPVPVVVPRYSYSSAGLFPRRRDVVSAGIFSAHGRSTALFISDYFDAISDDDDEEFISLIAG